MGIVRCTLMASTVERLQIHKLSDKNDMFYIFIMCGGFWVCNRAAVVDGGGAFGCPHIVASRQCGVIEIVTARAVNIDVFAVGYLLRIGALQKL